jgi:hypothetical protein
MLERESGSIAHPLSSGVSCCRHSSDQCARDMAHAVGHPALRAPQV